MPLKWVRKCEKGPVSEFTIEQLSDLSWIHSYLPGPENSLFDALSRYPLLGPRVLAPVGLSDAVSTLLDYLPDSLKDVRTVRVFTPPHTHKVAQQVQAWRHPTNPIDVHSFTHLHPPPPNTDFVLAMPCAEDPPASPHAFSRLASLSRFYYLWTWRPASPTPTSFTSSQIYNKNTSKQEKLFFWIVTTYGFSATCLLFKKFQKFSRTS